MISTKRHCLKSSSCSLLIWLRTLPILPNWLHVALLCQQKKPLTAFELKSWLTLILCVKHNTKDQSLIVVKIWLQVLTGKSRQLPNHFKTDRRLEEARAFMGWTVGMVRLTVAPAPDDTNDGDDTGQNLSWTLVKHSGLGLARMEGPHNDTWPPKP